MKGRREKEESEQDQPAPSGRGDEVAERSSHPGQLVETEGKYLRLLWRVKQLICDSLNGVRITQIICMYSRQGSKSTIVHGSWELEHMYWRVILGQGLLLTMRREPEDMGEGNLNLGSHGSSALLLSHA